MTEEEIKAEFEKRIIGLEVTVHKVEEWSYQDKLYIRVSKDNAHAQDYVIPEQATKDLIASMAYRLIILWALECHYRSQP